MSSSRPRAWRIADGAVIALLLAGAGLPLIGTLLGLGRTSENLDMRALEPFPTLEWSLSSLRTLPQRFDGWHQDHFGFRRHLLHGLAAVEVFGLKVSISPNVVLGRDSWLYYVHAPVGTDYEEVRPFTAAELDRWQRVLERRQEWLARRGCRYVLFLPPDKQTIYPEHFDPALRARHASGRLEQLVAHLRTHSDLTVVDVRQALLEAKQREPVYRITDSHWNRRGAFVGYRELARVLAGWFPQIRPFERSQFAEQVRHESGGDSARLLTLSDATGEEDYRLETLFPRKARRHDLPRSWLRANLEYTPPIAFDIPDPSLPRAVLFHDSFAVPFLDLLPEHFRRLVAVWHDDFHPDLVEREHPDVVIHELVERKLGYVVPNDLGGPVPSSPGP